MWDGTLRIVAVGEILCIGQRLKVKSMKYEKKKKKKGKEKNWLSPKANMGFTQFWCTLKHLYIFPKSQNIFERSAYTEQRG